MSSRADNRADFPLTAALIDEVQAAFGQVRVLYVCEAGKTMGTPSPDGVPVTLIWRPTIKTGAGHETTD